MLINVDEIDGDLQGLLDNNSDATPSHNNTSLPITSLTKSQKRNAKKKAIRKRRKHCNYILLLDWMNDLMPNNNGKKLKQKETNNSLKNENVIITGYYPQGEEQA
ncbi:hypothetical protein RCL_jg18883.t1 [Rhizophagus clarus]|uniref:Uncharacterized protein n=1 Tax=Rhizophagus clarus TaxID=94130 RepID=A0A8H3R367_9GLOM|nr:hypothetical protein RCL_jg18883.t1 [Rhizophagus clarus]